MADMGSRSRAVFTFGFGSEHNANMLFSLADAGSGCYYYVDTPQAIGPSFADCLGGLLSVAVQDVELKLTTLNGASICGEMHADFPVEMSEDRKEARVRMRDLNGDAQKEILLNLTVPALAAPVELWPM